MDIYLYYIYNRAFLLDLVSELFYYFFPCVGTLSFGFAM